MNSILVKDKIIELLSQVKEEIKSGVCCETCHHKCEQKGRCAVAMSNLMMDIQMFENSYQK